MGRRWRLGIGPLTGLSLYAVGVVIALVGYFADQGGCTAEPEEAAASSAPPSSERAPATLHGASSSSSRLLGVGVLSSARRAVETSRCNFSSGKPVAAR